MAGHCEFEHTKKALEELEQKLLCRICHMTLRDPYTLRSCQHIFCRGCAEAHAGDRCPECHIPSHMKDLMANRSMKNIVKLTKYLRTLLYDEDQAVLSESECASTVMVENDDVKRDVASDVPEKVEIDSPGRNNVVNDVDFVEPEAKSSECLDKDDPSLYSVYDFVGSPDAKSTAKKKKTKVAAKKKGVKSTPVVPTGSRVSRSKTLKEKKAQHLQEINDSWGVGDDKLSKCDSCKSKKGVRKTVRLVSPLSQEAKEGKENSDVKKVDDDVLVLEDGENGAQDEGAEGEVCCQKPKCLLENVGLDAPEGEKPGSSKDDSKLPPRMSLEKLKPTDLKVSQSDDVEVIEDKVDEPVENSGPAAKETGRRSPLVISSKEDGTLDNNKDSEQTDQSSKTRKKRQSLETPELVPLIKRSRKSLENADSVPKSSAGESKISPVECTTTPVSSKKSKSTINRTVLALDTPVSASGKKISRRSTGSEKKSLAEGSSSPLLMGKPGSKSSGNKQKDVGERDGSPVGKKATSRRSTTADGCVTPDQKTSGKKSRGGRSSETFASPVQKSVRSPLTTPSSRTKEKKNMRGETPLHVAAIKGDVEKVRSLLKDGANPNTKDNAGWTPLHEASNHGFTEIVALLLDHGAFINTPGMENDSPLLDAVLNYRLDTVKLLVSRGADLTLRNSSGQTPMDCAQTQDMKDVLNTPLVEVEPPVVIPSTPNSFKRTEKVVLLCTGLKRNQQTVVQKCSSMLHGRIVTDFSPEVTHVITGVNDQGLCVRTTKYFNAVLLGKWVLNFEWAEECLRHGERVCEEGFEIAGCSTHPDFTTPWKGRQNVEKQLPGLFDGCQIYFYGTFQAPLPEKKELVQLAKNGGATVLHREPKRENVDPKDITVPYHAKPGTYLADCCYYIIHDPKDKITAQRHFRVATAPTTWFLECISKFELLELPEVDVN